MILVLLWSAEVRGCDVGETNAILFHGDNGDARRALGCSHQGDDNAVRELSKCMQSP